jgi:hypothetical protein
VALSVRYLHYKAAGRCYHLFLFLFLCLFMFLPVMQAIAQIPAADDVPPSFEVEERPPWKEHAYDLPPYPSESDLMLVDLDVPGSRL